MKKYDYSKIFTPENVHLFANTNEDALVLPVKGIIIELPGLGGDSCLGGNMEMLSGGYLKEYTQRFAQKGILVVYMFPGPWSWGNKGAVRMTDAIVDALAKKYNLSHKFPLVVCGGSMGGLGALMYSADTNHKLCAVASACPCIDVMDRLCCKESFVRTYVSAVASYEMDLEEALKEISPAHRMEEFQKVPYFICSDGIDEVFPEEQCDKLVEDMKKKGHDVEYCKQPGLKHGEFFPEIRERLHIFMESAILSSD